MTWDGTVHLGDVIVVVVGLILIPAGKMLIGALWELRESFRELRVIVVGSERDPGSGLVAVTGEVKKEVLKHRDRLIRVESELGMKIGDRT